MQYELFYWPDIQGRGEFVRLALEEAGVEYVDRARVDAGAMDEVLAAAELDRPPFAVPALRHGDLVIAQTANILAWLGTHHGLEPADEDDRLWTRQLQLTLADWVDEIHDTHHPLGAEWYYEDQVVAARQRAALFRGQRLVKFMAYFERVLAHNPDRGGYLVGDRVGYADLSLFQVVEGLRYALPRAMVRVEPGHERIVALHAAIAGRPRIAAYLASDRRIPFNEHGIFRRYPELDE